jgi:hypothetical protein
MEEVPPVEAQQRCAAVPYLLYVDEVNNVDARKEFSNATNALQQPGADLGEGSAYVTKAEKVCFSTRSSDCQMCEGVATLLYDGSVSAPRCPISGTCEIAWAKNNPDNYTKEDGSLMAPLLPCQVELGCGALVGFNETDTGLTPYIAHGECKVDAQGCDWRGRYLRELPMVKLAAPEAGIEEFDGEGSEADRDDNEQGFEEKAV